MDMFFSTIASFGTLYFSATVGSSPNAREYAMLATPETYEVYEMDDQISSVMARLNNIARYGNAAEQIDYLTSDEVRVLKNLVDDVNTELKARRYEEEEHAD